ncbi:MAG: urea ABC transporter permease subunit UrtB, partial [Paracoccaceae bacterium]
MRAVLSLLLWSLIAIPSAGLAQTAETPDVAKILQDNRVLVEKPSRQTIAPVIAALAQSGDPQAAAILAAWADKGLGLRRSDGAFVLITETPEGYALRSLDGANAGTAAKAEITELRPNAGVRGVIATALVQFQLSDPDPSRRKAALTTIARDPSADLLDPLRASLAVETDPALKAQKDRLVRLLTLRFDPDSATRVSAIESFSGDLGLDLRAALNPLLVTQRLVAPRSVAFKGNIAGTLNPGSDLSETDAYDLLVAANLAPARLAPADLKAALAAHIVDGAIGGIPLSDLNTQSARNRAYTALESAGTVPLAATDEEVVQAVAAHHFADIYSETDPAVTSAANAVLTGIELKLAA